MDATYSKPFVCSMQNVFATMLQVRVDAGEACVKSLSPHANASSDSEFDVSAIIGLSGGVAGCAVLSSSITTAERIVSLFSGREVPAASPDFADAYGELINMIAGGAKAMFLNQRTSLTCPTVVLGRRHTISRPSNMPSVVIPCSTPCGPFSLEIA